jgi:DNA-binding MarR family transcriptional regulator
MLDEREFELVNIVGSEIASNQRDLSRHINLSLGQTNMLLRRLITKGYIRISKLDKRRVKYLLTPQGLAEKMDKSVKYTLRTISSISLIKERLKDLLKEIHAKGERHFFILGESDLASLVEMAMHELSFTDCSLTRVKDVPADSAVGTVLVCQEDVFDSVVATNKIDLIHELAKDSVLLKGAQ